MARNDDVDPATWTVNHGQTGLFSDALGEETADTDALRAFAAALVQAADVLDAQQA